MSKTWTVSSHCQNLQRVHLQLELQSIFIFDKYFMKDTIFSKSWDILTCWYLLLVLCVCFSTSLFSRGTKLLFKHVLGQLNHMLYKFLGLAGTCVSVFSHVHPFSHVIFNSIISNYDWKQKMYTTAVSFRFDFLWNASCENRCFHHLSIYTDCAS